MNKNRKKLSGALVSMLVLSGMNMDAMEEKITTESTKKSEINKSSGDQISLGDFGKKIKNTEKFMAISPEVKTKFDLILLRKMYEKSKESIEKNNVANIDLVFYNIFLTPKYPGKLNFVNKYKDFDISFKNSLLVSPISNEEIDNDPSNKNCETYFTWKNQQILSVIYLAIRTGGLSDGNGLKFIKDNVLVHHGKWGMSKYCILSEGISDDDKSDNNIPALNFTPAEFKEDTGEKDLAQSYDELIGYCTEAIKKLGNELATKKMISEFEVIGNHE